MRLITALVVIALVGGLAALDYYYWDAQAVTFLGKQLVRITDWIRFWR